MIHKKSKFEPAVHLGLLVIIFVLLILNFRSNLTIYHAGMEKRRAITVKFNNAAQSISRTMQKEGLAALSESRKSDLIRKHELSGLSLHTLSQMSAGAWRPHGNRDAAEDPILLEKIQLAPSKSLIRGNQNDYYYKFVFRSSDGSRMLLLSQTAPDFAYLEDSSKTLIIVNLVAVVLIIILYLVLFRLILSPFKRIKREAMDAGRAVAGETDDVEAMVDDYRQIIDELKEKERQLLELNEAIQARAENLELFNQYLLRSMSSGIVMVDSDARVMSVNKAAAAILSVDPQNMVGKKLDDLGDPFHKMFEPVHTLLDGGPGQSYREYDIKASDDTAMTLGITVSAVQDYSAKNVGASILINDLTEIKTLRGEIETKNRLAALGEMASGLAHQLRNSIGAMAGYCHLVKKRLTRNNLELDSIHALEDETREAERLVDRFLKFARPFDITAEPTDMADLVEELVETFRVRPDNSHIEFKVTGNMASRINAQVDRLLVKQALANLIENAVNAYQGEHGTVHVDLDTDATSVIVRIHDRGCGIAPENIEKIFTPFFSSRPSGTGLGLPLARKIIDLHRGRLSVTSIPDQGTTFIVTFPLIQKAQPASDVHPARESV